MSEPDQLPALPESEYLLARPARPYENEYITSFDGYSDDDMRSYALTAIATERARADALEAALSDVLEMAQEHADHFAAAFAGYKPERHAYYARALATARALLEKKT